MKEMVLMEYFCQGQTVLHACVGLKEAVPSALSNTRYHQWRRHSKPLEPVSPDEFGPWKDLRLCGRNGVTNDLSGTQCQSIKSTNEDGRSHRGLQPLHRIRFFSRTQQRVSGARNRVSDITPLL